MDTFQQSARNCNQDVNVALESINQTTTGQYQTEADQERAQHTTPYGETMETACFNSIHPSIDYPRQMMDNPAHDIVKASTIQHPSITPAQLDTGIGISSVIIITTLLTILTNTVNPKVPGGK